MTDNKQHPIEQLLKERILILDGAMGTVIQQYKLTEEDYRGERFRDFHKDVRGNNELLNLTRPEIIKEIHSRYFAAGSDIVETNTFNAQSISMADYDMQDLSRELNLEAARLAREAADEATAANPSKPRFVAGAIGPTNRSLSVATDVNDPSFRANVFQDFVTAYKEQITALIDGGVDILLVETIFDTAVSKAALFAISEVFKERGESLPVMASLTIVDKSGRNLSGQGAEAFLYSVNHFPLLSVGLNCALGPGEMRPFVNELSNLADCYVSCYPNAGLPNAMGGFDLTPDATAKFLREFAQEGWLNIAGGCCAHHPDG